MSFTQLLNTAADWASANVPVVIGGGVAVLVLTLVFVFSRRREPLDPARLAAARLAATGAAPNPLNTEKASDWAPPEQSYADRRGTVRRDGQPVRVVLFSPVLGKGMSDGFVLDRSTGGLRIAVSAAVPVGGTLEVKAANAPDTVGFVTVVVRSCRKNGDHFEVGCEFEKTPPWNVLLLFG